MKRQKKKQKQHKSIEKRARRRINAAEKSCDILKYIDFKTFTQHRIELAHKHINHERVIDSLSKNVSNLMDITSSLLDLISSVSNVPSEAMYEMFSKIYEGKKIIKYDGSIEGKVVSKEYNLKGGV